MTAPIAVSVLIPIHNAGRFLLEALRSVQAQTLRNFECLLIDDASTDDSGLIAENFGLADDRFRLIRRSRTGGPSAARNDGLDQARGEWIALLDADDLYTADRLERLTSIGDAERADLVVDEQVVTQFPATTSDRRAFGFRSARFAFTQEDFFAGSRLFRKPLAAGYIKPLMRRELLQTSQARYDPDVWSGEDFLFFARLFATRPKCVATSFSGYIYRRREGSISRSDTHLHFHSDLGRRVLDEWGSQLSAASKAALEGRERDLRQLIAALPTLSAARRWSIPDVAKSLLDRPSVAVTCGRLAYRKLLRTLLPYKRQAATLNQ